MSLNERTIYEIHLANAGFIQNQQPEMMSDEGKSPSDDEAAFQALVEDDQE